MGHPDMVNPYPEKTILSPAEYYERCKGQLRYMRDVEGPFESKLAKGERKRLKRCEADGFYVGPPDLTAAWLIVAGNRAAKGRIYSMSLEDWRAIEHIAFGVFPGTIAVALCVLPRPDTIYVQAWADRPGQQQRSPVILLAKGIYDYCLAHKIKTMDIGTADEPGLIAFKQRLGFEARIL